MKKIPTVFMREQVSRNKALAVNVVNPECQWVLDGQGVPTVKIDGTCCMVKDGVLYKRLDLKSDKPIPDGFIPADGRRAENGKGLGWVPVGDGPEDVWHREVINQARGLEDGTYELVGPKVQGNPYNLTGTHMLVRHGISVVEKYNPRTYEEIRAYLEAHELEGLVWWHPDGRMAKIKRRDFGIQWPVPGYNKHGQ